MAALATVITKQLSLKSLVIREKASVEPLTRILGRADFTLLKELVLVSQVPWESAFEDPRVHKHGSLFKSLLPGAQEQDNAMCRKPRKRGRGLPWLHRDLLRGRQKQQAHGLWKGGQVTQRTTDTLCTAAERRLTAQAQLELAGTAAGNKKGFYSTLTAKGRAENLPVCYLINQVTRSPQRDEDKAETLRVLTSV